MSIKKNVKDFVNVSSIDLNSNDTVLSVQNGNLKNLTKIVSKIKGGTNITVTASNGLDVNGYGAGDIIIDSTASNGATGPTGPTGPQGSTGLGATGATGPIGSTGPQGASGIIGPTGPQGATGPSVGPNYIGSTGPIGPTGATGPEGATGVAGSRGSTGATGLVGSEGATGATGPAGNGFSEGVNNIQGGLIIGTGQCYSNSFYSGTLLYLNNSGTTNLQITNCKGNQFIISAGDESSFIGNISGNDLLLGTNAFTRLNITKAGEIYITGRTSIGSSTLSGVASNHGRLIVTDAGNDNIVLTSTSSDATNKGGVLKGARKTNSNTPFNGLGVFDNGSVREVSIGGGGWGSPDATLVNIYAGPYNENSNSAPSPMAIFSNDGLVSLTGRISIGNPAVTNTANLFVNNSGVARALVQNTANSMNSVIQSDTGSSFFGTSTNHDVNFMTNSTSRLRASAGGEIYITGRTSIGSTTLASVVSNGVPHGRLIVTDAGYDNIVLTSTSSDATNKGGVLKGARKTNSNTPFNGLGVYDDGSIREVTIGGGGWGSPDATVVKIHAGPYNETDNGASSSIMEINGNKHVSIGSFTSTSASITAGALRVIDSSAAYKGIVSSNTTGDNTTKVMTIGCARFNNANQPFTAFGGYDNGTLRIAEVGGSAYSSSPGANIIDFWTANGDSTENRRMRIWNTGSVLIGQTAPLSSPANLMLQVNGRISSLTALVTTSDIKYKENIHPLSGGLNIINNLSPKTFTWKENQGIVTAYNPTKNKIEILREAYNFDKGVQVGFIAQEVQQLISGKPWSENVIQHCTRPPVYGFSGELLAEEEKFLQIAETSLITILTSAVKELSLEVNNLKSKVWNLESNISNN